MVLDLVLKVFFGEKKEQPLQSGFSSEANSWENDLLGEVGDFSQGRSRFKPLESFNKKIHEWTMKI